MYLGHVPDKAFKISNNAHIIQQGILDVTTELIRFDFRFIRNPEFGETVARKQPLLIAVEEL